MVDNRFSVSLSNPQHLSLTGKGAQSYERIGSIGFMSTMTTMKLVCAGLAAALLLIFPLQATSRTSGFPYEAVPDSYVVLDSDDVPLRLEAPEPPKALVAVEKPVETRWVYITGYNTVAGQTDSTPCIAAGGNICGRMDTVACPSDVPLHSWVSINGKKYQCMDRTAKKHNGRFDISCDKDLACPYKHTGWRTVTILDR